MANKPEYFAFIGHDFFGTRHGAKARYRASIASALNSVSSKLPFRLRALYGDSPPNRAVMAAAGKRNIDPDDIRSENYWPRIIAYIRLSDIAVMDLRSHATPPEPANWNVLLELGVAYGACPRRLIISRDRIWVLRNLSNIQGIEVEEPASKRFDNWLASRISPRFIGMVSP